MKISRRDTIIIAALVNVSLLALLFATSSKMDEKIIAKSPSIQVSQETPVAVKPVVESQVMQVAAKEPVDEIDQVLHEYALKQKIKVQPVKKEAQVTLEPPKKVKAKKAAQAIAQEEKSAAEQESAEEPQYYIVKNGDSPWKIAKKFHLKYEDLLRLNNLDEAKAKNLKIGQKLRIR